MVACLYKSLPLLVNFCYSPIIIFSLIYLQQVHTHPDMGTADLDQGALDNPGKQTGSKQLAPAGGKVGRPRKVPNKSGKNEKKRLVKRYCSCVKYPLTKYHKAPN